LIVAVNTDEGAAIFPQADYGVVADLYEFLPALMDRIKARGIRPVWMS
jgi:electron transfer flavoprotein alpha subunit